MSPNAPTASGLSSTHAKPAEPPASQSPRSKTLPLFLCALVTSAIIAGVIFLFLPRTTPLTEARERLARIESMRLLRRLDALRAKLIGENRRRESLLVVGALSIPEEQRGRVTKLLQILEGPKAE